MPKKITVDEYLAKVTKTKVIDIAEKYDEECFDMDLAWNLYYDIAEILKEGKFRPVLDFSNVTKIHSYFLVISIGQYVAKYKERTNLLIGIFGLSKKNMNLLNFIAKEAILNGKEILNGLQDSWNQEDLSSGSDSSIS